jgi:hypothetical protein
MGAKTMFDLNKSLRDWQQQLRQGEGCSHDNIDELEEHLREEMEGLTQVGLSREEAFLLGTRRLGNIDFLNDEFGKVNTRFVWLNRLRWMASGVLICLGASTAEAAFRRVLTAGAVMAGLTPLVAGVLITLASIGVMTLAAILVMRAISRRRIDSAGTYPRALAAKCSLLFCVLLWFTLLPLCGSASYAFLFRHVSPVNWSGLHLGSYYVESALSIILPLVIAGWMLKGTKKGVSVGPAS